jgi:heme/copper-type cytochrome/quinol oxidase subunit 4
MHLQQHEEKMPKWAYVFIWFASFLWVVAGVAAFIVSLMCFGGSGTLGQHVVGFLLAVFFGPFYWIYYMVSQTYCRKLKI